jgi:hypothetical protein
VHWRDDSLIYLLFAQFLLVTAVYFGQTNHRVFLDVYFIVFGAGVISKMHARRRQQAPAENSGVSPP